MIAKTLKSAGIQTVDDAADESRVLKCCEQIEQEKWLARLWRKDPTLWTHKTAEIKERLGWLDLPDAMAAKISELRDFAKQIISAKFQHVVLLGMGGSSLAPEVFMKTFGATARLTMTVLDTIHPKTVARVKNALDLGKTLFLVSSKSGTTLETISLFEYFYAQLLSLSANPGEHFVAITDQGSPLQKIAMEKKFRKIFIAPSDVGGRYGALSYFGLVPAALLEVDLTKVLASASRMVERCAANVSADNNPAVTLAAILAQPVLAGRAQLSLCDDPKIPGLVSWIEQLLAESSGKEGGGLVPVIVQADQRPTATAIQIVIDDPIELGGQFFLWEMATALLGVILQLNPFDQPDVELSKKKTQALLTLYKDGWHGGGQSAARTRFRHARSADRAAVTGPVFISETLTPETLSYASDLIASENKIEFYSSMPQDTKSLSDATQNFLALKQPEDYLALLLYIDALHGEPADPQVTKQITELHKQCEKLGMALTVGYGPRYLHSTGQLHKGGTNRGLFLIVSELSGDMPLARLIAAQAQGDYLALKERKRRVGHLLIKDSITRGLEYILHGLA